MAKAPSGPSRRKRCDYKRLRLKKGLDKLQNLIPGSSNDSDDEVKLVIDAMFYISQLEVKAKQLKQTVKKMEKKKDSLSSTVTSSETYLPDKQESLMGLDENTNGAVELPDDLKDLDEVELRQLHATPIDLKKELIKLESVQGNEAIDEDI